MFEDLTKKINMENLNKVRKNNEKSRYPKQKEQEADEVQLSQNSDLDDLQIKLEQHSQNLRKIQATNQQQSANFLKRDNTIPPNMLRRVYNQMELLKQKIDIQRVQNQRRIQYEKELFKRREEWFEVESSKLKHLVKKYKLEAEQAKQLKKDLDNANQINNSLEERLQNKDQDNRKLRQLVDQLQKQLISIKLNKNQQQIQINEKQKLIKMSNRIQQLQQNLAYQKSYNQEKKKKIEKAMSQLQEMKVKFDHREVLFEQIMAKKQEQYRKKQEKLEAQINNLNKRNQNLEQTFIQKMSQIAQLQANILTNSAVRNIQSITIQASKKQKSSQQTLNLQNQSPIKPIAQQNTQSERKQPAQNKKNSIDNPEHPIKINQTNQCECCHKKIQRFKQKLQEANMKIVQLLQQKAVKKTKNKSYVQTTDKFFGESQTMYQNCRDCSATRTKLLNWKMF